MASAAAVTIYLPAPIVSRPPIRSDESNTLSTLACTLALGTLSYYAPRTFGVIAEGLLGLSIWGFARLVSTSTLIDTDTQHLRTIAIRICTVMTSVGFVFGFRGMACFWSSMKALRHFHLLRTGGNFIAGTVNILAAAALCYIFKNRAVELMKTKNWDQMADFLQFQQRFPLLGKIQLFGIVFFPQFIRGGRPVLTQQFKSPEDKFINLQRYLPLAKSYSLFIIHDFQAQPFWSQETLMPELVRIGRASPVSVDGLPEDIKIRLRDAMPNYRNPEEPWDPLEDFLRIPSIPEVGAKNWEVFVDVANRIPGMPPHEQAPYIQKLREIISASTGRQVEQLPVQIIELCNFRI